MGLLKTLIQNFAKEKDKTMEVKINDEIKNYNESKHAPGDFEKYVDIPDTIIFFNGTNSSL